MDSAGSGAMVRWLEERRVAELLSIGVEVIRWKACGSSNVTPMKETLL